MKRLVRSLIQVAEIVMLVAIVILVILVLQQFENQATSSPCPPPLTANFRSPAIAGWGTNTVAPKFFTPPPSRKTTPIVFKTSKVVDMRPDLSADEKGEVIICKPAGVYAKILTPPTVRLAIYPLNRET